ncbi:MAG: hypothetical protein NZ571_08865 [Anaerolineae bacterium]|nr:hypothetical protein [Anaerolineae bacterium]
MRCLRHFYLLALALSLMTLSVLPAAAQDNRRLIFEETFGANHSGWKVADSDGAVDVTRNAVSISVSKEAIAVWATPALTVPEDVEIEVEARAINPDRSGNWNLGVLLRVNRRDLDGSFYHFGVAGDGTWEFSVRPPDADRYVNAIEYGKLSEFNPNRPITLRVLASGNTFTFYINNRLIRQFTDDTLPSTPDRERFFGLMAGTYEGVSKHTVEFRRITVHEIARQRAFFRDTFPDSNPSGWGTSERAGEYSVKIENNSLMIEVLKSNWFVWTRPDRRFPQDVDLRVDVVSDSPSSGEWYYGIGVRGYFENNANYFYLFTVQSTGRFTFTTQRDAVTINTLIDETRITDFNPSTKHTLRVRAVGDVFTLFVNDRQVGSVRATNLKAQPDYTVFLVAGTFPSAQAARARFANFRAEAPR